MLHERHQHDQLRREEQRARDHEGDRRVEPVVRAAADEEELGDRARRRPGPRRSASRPRSAGRARARGRRRCVTAAPSARRYACARRGKPSAMRCALCGRVVFDRRDALALPHRWAGLSPRRAQSSRSRSSTWRSSRWRSSRSPLSKWRRPGRCRPGRRRPRGGRPGCRRPGRRRPGRRIPGGIRQCGSRPGRFVEDRNRAAVGIRNQELVQARVRVRGICRPSAVVRGDLADARGERLTEAERSRGPHQRALHLVGRPARVQGEDVGRDSGDERRRERGARHRHVTRRDDPVGALRERASSRRARRRSASGRAPRSRA